MALTLHWLPRAMTDYESIKRKAVAAQSGREVKGKTWSSKPEGLFKQVNKALRLLRENPKHPGLNTHEFDSIDHPYHKDQKVFVSYIQNNTSGAYRHFWCYGPDGGEATIIAITPHP